MRAATLRRSFLRTLCAVALVAAPGCEPRDPFERIRTAQDERGDFAGTLEPLRELASARPDDPEVQFRYGLALIATGHQSLAMWPLRKAAESQEWLERAGLTLARTAAGLGRWDEAIAVSSRILDHQPDHLEALLSRADARVRSRRQIEAGLEDAERVLERDPDDVRALVPKTAALLALGRVDEAGAALETLEGLHRDDSLGLHGSPPLCAAQATFRKEKGDVEQAEERFGRCLEQFPGDLTVISEAVSFFDSIDRRDRSQEIVIRALERVPDAFELRAYLFDRLRAAGQEKEAEAVLRAATELESPESATVGWAAVALYELEKGNFDTAARAFERARDLDPTDSQEIRFGYADALVVAGRHDDALRVAESLSVPVHRSLVIGRVALARGEPARALSAFEEANRLWPNNAVARYYTAIAAEQVGRFARAVEDYRYSMRIDNRATDAYLRLARLQLAAGRSDEALVALEFQPGERPGEEEAGLLRLELLARLGRPAPSPLPARYSSPDRRAAAVAALATGLRARLGPKEAVRFVESQKDLDLRDPRHAEALSVLLDALAETGRATRGLARVDAALAAHPNAAPLYALRGQALAAARRPASAVRAAYERALDLDPTDFAALTGLARLESEAGQAEQALALYARALQVRSSDRETVRAAALLFVEQGRPSEAEDRLAALLREHPYDALAAIELAKLRLARNADPAATRELAQRAVAFGGGDVAEKFLERLDAQHRPDRAKAPESS